MTHPDWPAIEAAYRDGDCTVVQIMARYGITQSQLYRYARAHGWPRRRKPLPVRGVILDTVARPDDVSLAMLSRLSASLGTLINELEKSVGQKDRKARDSEHETRLLGSLTQVLEKLMALAARYDKPETDADIFDTKAHHDRIVSALAERVARLGNDRTADALLAGADASRS
ncbi:hypothetical protein [Pyruvatibacter sp.]